MIKTILYIAIGGAIGSVLRYITSLIVTKYWSGNFPLATFLINSLGCLIIGILIGLLEKNNVNNSALKFLLITGFCGGFTTFSAFGYENYNLINNHHSIVSFVYMALSIFVGLFCVWFGLYISKNLVLF
jgi:fluoride exporter